MLRPDQIIGYIDRSLAPDEVTGVEAELTANPAAGAQLADFAGYDSVLRALAGGSAELARIEESVIERIQQSQAHDFGHQQNNQRNTMSDSKSTPDHADEVTRKTQEDQLRHQGVDIIGRSPSKDEQVSKEMKEEETWDQKKSPDPKPGRTSETDQKPEQDNDYYNGISP